VHDAAGPGDPAWRSGPQEADFQLKGRRELSVRQCCEQRGAECRVEHRREETALHAAHRIGEIIAGIKEDLDLTAIGSDPGQLLAQRDGGRRRRLPSVGYLPERTGPARRGLVHDGRIAQESLSAGHASTIFR
jgi:hypothetical protein